MDLMFVIAISAVLVVSLSISLKKWDAKLKWLKEVAMFVVRILVFAALFYIAGAFINMSLDSAFSNSKNLWQPLIYLSVYLFVIMVFFYYLGLLFSIFANESWSIWLDSAFCIAITAWGSITIIREDIAKIAGGMFWGLANGLAHPVYAVIYEITGNNINYYKYVFIGFWLLISLAMFMGLRQKYIRKQLKLSAVILLSVLSLSINTPTIINIFTPHMFDKQSYPKIDGATAAIPLGQTLAERLLGKDVVEAKNYVKFNTTHDAYVNLINKNADLIFAAEPSDEEISLAEQNGIKLKLTSVGMDAFVFIVNNENPINDLTIEQIRKIYSGHITNWKDIDGVTDLDIMAYQRSKNSGSQTLMENVVMKGLQIMEAPSERKPGDMVSIIDAIDYKNSENAIGYTVYYFANEMYKKENIKFLAVNGIPCNKDTIRSKEYPFSGSLYAVTRENDESESTKKLLEFLLTEKGQDYIEIGGFVPVKSQEG